jgi:flavin reductase (DIM6/NTAB) family NADH-FMN oxidoreductase RutF
MKEKWIQAFGKMTYGLYVLTSKTDDVINGMIASWVSQVSYEPPLIMVAVHPRRYSHQLIEKSQIFALHVLDKTRTDFLERFKGPDPAAKFDSLDWHPGKSSCPILHDCLAYFECQLVTRIQPGNHTLFIGEVVDAGGFFEGLPLTTLEYNGVYLGKT